MLETALGLGRESWIPLSREGLSFEQLPTLQVFLIKALFTSDII